MATRGTRGALARVACGFTGPASTLAPVSSSGTRPASPVRGLAGAPAEGPSTGEGDPSSGLERVVEASLTLVRERAKLKVRSCLAPLQAYAAASVCQDPRPCPGCHPWASPLPSHSRSPSAHILASLQLTFSLPFSSWPAPGVWGVSWGFCGCGSRYGPRAPCVRGGTAGRAGAAAGGRRGVGVPAGGAPGPQLVVPAGPRVRPPRIREAIWCGSTNATTEEGKELTDPRVLTDAGDVPVQEMRDCGVSDERLMRTVSDSVRLVMAEVRRPPLPALGRGTPNPLASL